MVKAEKHDGQRVKFHMSGTLNVAIFKEGRTYIAYAPGLDLVAQGKNISDARKNFEELVDIYFEETVSKGTLEKDLLRCGWKKNAGVIHPPLFAEFPSEKQTGDIQLRALAMISLADKKLTCPA